MKTQYVNGSPFASKPPPESKPTTASSIELVNSADLAPLDVAVMDAANQLALCLASAVSVRFSSDRRAGGAWIVSPAIPGGFEDSDIGVCITEVVVEELFQKFSANFGEPHASRLVGDFLRDLKLPESTRGRVQTIYVHISRRALNDEALADNSTYDPNRAYLHRQMDSVEAALGFIKQHAKPIDQLGKASE